MKITHVLNECWGACRDCSQSVGHDAATPALFRITKFAICFNGAALQLPGAFAASPSRLLGHLVYSVSVFTGARPAGDGVAQLQPDQGPAVSRHKKAPTHEDAAQGAARTTRCRMTHTCGAPGAEHQAAAAPAGCPKRKGGRDMWQHAARRRQWSSRQDAAGLLPHYHVPFAFCTSSGSISARFTDLLGGRQVHVLHHDRGVGCKRCKPGQHLHRNAAGYHATGRAVFQRLVHYRCDHSAHRLCRSAAMLTTVEEHIFGCGASKSVSPAGACFVCCSTCRSQSQTAFNPSRKTQDTRLSGDNSVSGCSGAESAAEWETC